MINIDKDYLITVDLKNTKVKSDKTIFFYNTDLNICNIFIKLICSDKDKTIPEDLIVELAVLKPETDEFKPLDATLISKEDLLYQVDLTTDYFDIVGKYSCEIRVSGTIENELKCFTSEEFDYVVKPNITAKLNKKIKNDKNLPILEKLIKDVKEITDGINKNEIQMKRDENLVGDNKTVVGAINQLREDVNSGIGGGTVELKDYQKKNDEFLNTDEKTITGGINEVNNKIKKVQESQIELDKDDVSFNGIDDISHDELNTTNKTLIGAINEVNTQCKDIANFKKSVKLKAKLLDAINNKNFTVCCRGDSVTYGQAGDTSAQDNRDPLDGHTAIRAKITYPEALEEALKHVYGENISVINRGFSGDKVKTSFTRWTVSCNSDVTLIALGINDAIQNTAIEEFINTYKKIIEQEILWGSYPIPVLPTRIGSTSDVKLNNIRKIIINIANEYNLEYIDALELLRNYSSGDIAPSDNIHLTSYGYSVLGKRIASCFMGNTLFRPNIIKSNSKVQLKTSIDSINIIKNSKIGGSSDSTGAWDLNSSSTQCTITGDGEIIYSFYSDEDDLLVIPIYLTNSSSWEYSLDFALNQPDVSMSDYVNQPKGKTILKSISMPIYNRTDNLFSKVPPCSFSDILKNFIQITSKGWHTIMIKNKTPNTNILFYGMIFINYSDAYNRFNLIKISDVPTSGSYEKGEWFINSNIEAGNYFGYVCLEKGTFGKPLLTTTATIKSAWSGGLCLSDKDLQVGDRIIVEGSGRDVFKITSRSNAAEADGTYYYGVEPVTSDKLVTNASVRLAEPIIKGFGKIES